MYQAINRFLVIFLVSCVTFCNIHAQAQKSSVSAIEFGPATNLSGPAGFTVGYSQFDKICLFIDYLGILDKDGFIYHEISSKFGLYTTDEKTFNFSVSTGVALAIYAQRNQNTFYRYGQSEKSTPFAGIPIQARIDFSPRSRIGGGIKYAHIFTITNSHESQSMLSFFLSIRLTRDLKD